MAGQSVVPILSVMVDMFSVRKSIFLHNHCSGTKKRTPTRKSGGHNQKPLTIKPYPMKIQD